MLFKSKIAIGGGVLLVLALAASIAAIVLTLSEWPDENMHAKVDESLVTTFYGRIQGRNLRTIYNQKPYYAFQGIPYARPPLGELRFKVIASYRIRLFYGETNEESLNFSHHNEQTIGMESAMPINSEVNVFKRTREVQKIACSLMYIHPVRMKATVFGPMIEINFFTATNPSALLPVVIAIHGGFFHTGSANAYSPDLLLNEADVVVVCS